MKIQPGPDIGVCDVCATQKAKRAAITKTWGTRATESLAIVHTDILGPMQTESVDGERYAIGFIDSYSRFATVYLMRTRDEAPEKMKQFVADVGRPRTLVTDGAKEYTSRETESFCRDQGIRHERSAPYVPEDNGKAERIRATIMDMTRCMIEQAGVPQEYWSHAIRAAYYTKNRSVHSAHGKTPFAVFFGT